jgi:hypothetical protein
MRAFSASEGVSSLRINWFSAPAQAKSPAPENRSLVPGAIFFVIYIETWVGRSSDVV